MKIEINGTHEEATILRKIADALEPPAIHARKAIPRLGEMWEEQGGINLGFVAGEYGRPDYYSILPLDGEAYFEDVELGPYGKEVDGAKHKRDGYANTIALAGAGSDLCKKILDLEIGRFDDFYLPSQFEAYLIYAYAQEHVVQKWHWTSTQYSALLAFGQYFDDGYQGGGTKGYRARARAVRRFIVQ